MGPALMELCAVDGAKASVPGPCDDERRKSNPRKWAFCISTNPHAATIPFALLVVRDSMRDTTGASAAASTR